MNVKYVVSIAGELLYFDDRHTPVPELPRSGFSDARKPALKLLPVDEKPAARSEWDHALQTYSAEQRDQAEISEVQAGSEAAR